MNTKKRFRDYGLTVGQLPPGKRNLISDVPGVQVGHFSKIEGSDIRTGITLIDPGVPDLYAQKLPAAVAVGNGFGKLVGSTQIEELGSLETPIALTNTLAVGPVMRGLVDLVLAQNPKIKPLETINAVVGETNDGFLNAIHKNTLGAAEVAKAFDQRSPDFALGAVGAGTGTRAFAWKGGIGSASRQISIGNQTYTLGALVQTNYGGSLTMLGAPIGQLLQHTDFTPAATDGSCMIIIATDAPLSARQLGRLARRAPLALARTGSVMAHGSGDYALAFSSSAAGLETSAAAGLADGELTHFFLAVVEAIEESVYDALFLAEAIQGRDGNTLEALPVQRVVEILKGVR